MLRSLCALPVLALLPLLAFGQHVGHKQQQIFPPGQTETAVYPPPSLGPASPPVSGMVLWISADCITYTSSVCGVPSDGSTVTTWADRSGNANNVTLTGTTVAFHANQQHTLPAVTMSAPQGSLTTTLAYTQRTWTYFVVAKETNCCGNQGYFFGCTGGTCFAYSYGPNAKFNSIAKQDFSTIASGNLGQDSNWHQQNTTYNDSTGAWAFRINEAADGSGTSTTNQIGHVVDKLFYDANAGGFNFTGQLGEAIAYNRILSGSEISQVEAWLLARWGV